MLETELFKKCITMRNDFNPPLTAREILDFVLTNHPETERSLQAQAFGEVARQLEARAIWLKDIRFMSKAEADRKIKEVNAEIEIWMDKKRNAQSEFVADCCDFNIEDLVGKKMKIKARLRTFGNKHHDFSENIKRAKEVPIDNFIEFDGAGFARCLWHDERSGSLKYYPRTNTCHCFGCGKNVDSIDVIQELKKVDFKNAINFLLK